MPSGPPARVYQKSKNHSTGFGVPLPDGPQRTGPGPGRIVSGVALQDVARPLQRHRGGVNQSRVG